MNRILCVIVLGSTSLKAAPFRNLDFNSPIGPITPFELPTERALPGWTAYTGTTLEKRILYEDRFLGSAGLGLVAIVPRKDYLVSFYSGGSLYGEGGVPTGIYQTGDVPASAKTLLFQGDTFKPEPNVLFRVTLDGVPLSLQPVTEGTFGADVSAFAGQTAELRFQANYLPERAFPQVFFNLDNIRFSPDALVTLVPEPSTWALLGVGGAFLLAVSRRPKA